MPEANVRKWLLDKALIEIQDWLIARLRGRDPVWSLDERADEDPESLLIEIITTFGYGDAAVDRLMAAIVDMLSPYSVLVVNQPDWLPPVLRLCERIQLPPLGEWFLRELTLLAEQQVDSAEGGRFAPFLLAAARQVPAQNDGFLEELWLALLARGGAGEVPLLGLSHSFRGRVRHMGVWWRSAPPADRPEQLKSMVRVARRLERDEDVLMELRACAFSLPREVVQIISDGFAVSSSQGNAGGQRSIANALHGAGLRPDILNESLAGTAV